LFRERNGDPAMTTGFLVIVGYLGIGIERCWKHLLEAREYSWKSNSVKFFEVLFKANNWSFDLTSVVPWFSIDRGPSLILERQQKELLSEHVLLRYRAQMRISSRSGYLPVSSRRFFAD
jgi:hypothetical protein